MKDIKRIKQEIADVTRELNQARYSLDKEKIAYVEGALWAYNWILSDED